MPSFVSQDSVAAAASSIEAAAASRGLPLDIETVQALRALQAHAGPLSEVRRLLGRGVMKRADVEVLFAQARLVGRAAAPVILDMLFEKATHGDDCPYSLEALTFLAKGFGVVSPNKPVDDLERAQAATVAGKVAQMSDKDLIADIVSRVRATHDAARSAKEEEKSRA